jgi:cell division septation protein DedD
LEKEFPDSIEARQAKILGQELYFTVQVGSFINRKNAEALAGELKGRNFAAFISSLSKEGRNYYRVRVGKYKHRTTAEIMQDRLRSYGYPATVYP